MCSLLNSYFVPDWKPKAFVLIEFTFWGLKDKDKQEKQCTQINMAVIICHAIKL